MILKKSILYYNKAKVIVRNLENAELKIRLKIGFGSYYLAKKTYKKAFEYFNDALDAAIKYNYE